MNDKLKIAIDALFDSLTVVWEDNGNIMADAVRDSVMTRLSEITGISFNDIEARVDRLVENSQ